MVLDTSLVDKVRKRLIRMHFESGVGHLGGNLSVIDAMLLIHHELLGPRDQFILSKGHSAGAYYATLWSLGKLEEQELASFHKDGTRLAGHPPSNAIPEIAFATGSLGHGLSLAAGLALAAKLRKQDRRVFCVTSDGEWQEGSTLEALIFAAHHKLDNLIVAVDHNGLQGFGSTRDVASMDPLDDRLAGFDVDIRKCDGHNLDAMRQTLGPSGSGRPVIAVLRTRKGRGVPEFEGKMESHYLPLTRDQYDRALTAISGTP